MISVLVLGGESGIGREIVRMLARDQDTQVWVTFADRTLRGSDNRRNLLFKPPAGRGACTERLQAVLEAAKPQAVVNCLYAPPEESEEDIAQALLLNSLLPRIVASEVNRIGAITIQPSSYAVFQPSGDLRTETSATDATTVYGRSSAIGEVSTKGVYHLRADIIGPRIPGNLLDTIYETESVLDVAKDTYSKPITTLAFAKIVRGLIRDEAKRARIGNLHHLMSEGATSVFDQAVSLISHFRQERMSVVDTQRPGSAEESVRVGTDAPAEHALLWEMAGYLDVPTFDELAEELHAHCVAESEYVC
jgi:dTDP-4-dehydrorhamnose reductase